MLQLFGGRQRHEIAAVLEATRLDDLVQHLRTQPGHDMGEVRAVENALEEGTPVARAAAANEVSHGTGDDTDRRLKETVLNGISEATDN